MRPRPKLIGATQLEPGVFKAQVVGEVLLQQDLSADRPDESLGRRGAARPVPWLEPNQAPLGILPFPKGAVDVNTPDAPRLARTAPHRLLL